MANLSCAHCAAARWELHKFTKKQVARPEIILAGSYLSLRVWMLTNRSLSLLALPPSLTLYTKRPPQPKLPRKGCRQLTGVQISLYSAYLLLFHSVVFQSHGSRTKGHSNCGPTQVEARPKLKARRSRGRNRSWPLA